MADDTEFAPAPEPIRNKAGQIIAHYVSGSWPAEDDMHLQVYTAFLDFADEEVGEEIDVVAINEKVAREMVQKTIEWGYDMDLKITRIEPRMRGIMYI